MDLPGGNFWPRPNVDSRTVVMSRKEEFPCCKNPDSFMKLQRALFVSRRKTVRNNLSPLFNNSEEVLKVLEEANINPMARAESLSIEQLLMLSDIINNGII
jgi:16S rRNA (adenine1518-N6/adenine1519-N6)-dimethyltransferase